MPIYVLPWIFMDEVEGEKESMKKLLRIGKRGLAGFLALLLILTGALTGNVLQAWANQVPCSLNVLPYDNSHGCIEYLSVEGEWETIGDNGGEYEAKAVRFSAEQGWYVSQVVYNGATIDSPANQYDFDSEGAKSVSGITFSQVAQSDDSDSQSSDNDQNQGGDTEQTQEPDSTQDLSINECNLNVSNYDSAHGFIEYKLNGDSWTTVPGDGCSETATAVRFGANDGWYVSQIVYNGNTIDNPETDHFDFSEEESVNITGITFAEARPVLRNSPPILRSPSQDNNYYIQMGQYSTEHGKIQYSTNSGSTWNDIPAGGLEGQIQATHVKAVIMDDGYEVSYEVEGDTYTDTAPHALYGDIHVQWIQQVAFTNPVKNLTVLSYDSTKGTVQISTDETDWTDVDPNSNNVPARYVRVVPSGNYVLNSYKINNNTIYTESSQELTAENNTLSDISFIENAGGGQFNLNLNDQTNGASTVTVTFLNSAGSSVGTATAGSDVDIPVNTARIRIVVSNKDLLNSVQLIRRNVGATDNGTEILRQELEESLWNSGTVEFAASNAYIYRLNVTLSNTKNVMWDYRESARGTDTFVEHCQLFLLDEHGVRLAYHDDVANRDTEDYVAYNLTIGESYQFELVPDYGYQISGLTINGYAVEAADDTGVFDFTMTNNNFHFAGVVAPAEDLVSAPQAYSGATIANGSNAADSGNVRMTIAEKTVDNSAASVVGNDATAVATLDIDLDKVVSKGDGSYWSSGITAFTNDVTISVPVSAEGLTDGHTYTVVRDHNGTKTALEDATYNKTTGMLTFDSNRFSDYTVVKTVGEPETTPAGDPVDSVTLTVRFEGTQYDHFDVHKTAEQVLTEASPVLFKKTGTNDNDRVGYANEESFTITPGSDLPLYLKLTAGYVIDWRGTGTVLNGDFVEFFDDDWSINEGADNPGSASYATSHIPEQCYNSTIDLVIKIYRIDDPTEDPTYDPNHQPGKASSFSVSFKDDSDAHVQVMYQVAEDNTVYTVPAEGDTANNVEWFRVVPDPGYVLTDDATIAITQTAGTNRGDNDANDLLKNFDPAYSEWGFWFVGNTIDDTQNVYTCTISNVSVREATPAELLGKYRMVLVTKDGVSLTNSLDAGALDASGNEIPSTYTSIPAGSTEGSTGYVALPEDAAQIFVTMTPTDGNNFETATLVGYDENGTQVSSVTYDYDEVKNTQMGCRAVNPAYSYVLTVTFSRQKKIYWTSADTANCSLYLLTAEGNNANLNPNSRRNGSEFLAQINGIYYFLMIPNYGYQINSLVINGNRIIPMQGDANMGIFQFEMGNADFHIQPSLTRSNDVVNNTSQKVGSVSLSNGAAAGVGGNLSMTVADRATDNSAVDYVNADGEGEVTAVATVNIDMNQIVSQGNNTNWNKELRNLAGDVTLALAVPANGLEPGETYSVVRHHGDEMRELNAIYNSTTGLLTFPTNGFSEYTIVRKPGTPVISIVTQSTPSTENSDSSGDDDDDDDDDNNLGSTANLVNSTLGIIVDGTTTAGDSAANTVIKDWDDLNEVLLKDSSNSNNSTTGSKDKKKRILTDRQKAKGALVQVVLNKKNATVPDSTFEALYNSDKSGLHTFVENGTALTFFNNRQLRNQKALDLSCKITTYQHSKTIAFNKFAKLKAKTALHTTVPAGVRSVNVYRYDANGNKRYVGRVIPTAEGRICFEIKELTTYVLEY